MTSFPALALPRGGNFLQGAHKTDLRQKVSCVVVRIAHNYDNEKSSKAFFFVCKGYEHVVFER